MHIDFAPPSNGTYNNAGSSRQLANYLEHEDLERIEKGVYTEGFFNLTDDNIYKSKVINMHCHLIVSRKDQANKKKLSPLTNHKNTKNGVIKGGFDRVNLFQQTEQGFDKLFDYNRQLSELFDYHNTMKNGSLKDKLQMQKQELKAPENIFTGEKKKAIEKIQIGKKETEMPASRIANKTGKQLFKQY